MRQTNLIDCQGTEQLVTCWGWRSAHLPQGIASLVVGMLNTGGDPDVPHRPMSTDLVPDFPAMPDLKELIFLHPDYLYLLEGLSLEYTRQLSSISLRCTSVSSISPRSSVRKLLDVLPDVRKTQWTEIVIDSTLVESLGAAARHGPCGGRSGASACQMT